MELVQIDDLDAEPFEAVFALLDNPVAGQVAEDRVAVPAGLFATALGGDQRAFAVAELGETFANHFLGATKAIHGGGIDPVDAGVDSRVDCGDRVRLLLRPPAHPPVTATHGPGAKTDRGEFEIAAAKFPFLHDGKLSPARGGGKTFPAVSCWCLVLGSWWLVLDLPADLRSNLGAVHHRTAPVAR